MKCGKDIIKAIIWGVTAEFILRNKNGGAVIVARATIIAIELFVLGLSLLNWIDPNKVFWSCNPTELGRQATEHISWFGTMWGGVYLALYARFASHWAYLAGLYNKVLELEATGARDLRKLKHAFVVDAEELHLLGTDLFRFPARRWLMEEEVIKWFIEQNSLESYKSDLKLVGVEGEALDAQMERAKAILAPSGN